MKTIKICFYSLLVLLSAYYTTQAITFGMWQGFGPGPGLMPLILGVSMFILSLYQLFSKDGIRSKEKEIFLGREERKRLVTLLLVNVLATVFLETAGFIIVIMAYCLVILLYLSKWSVKKGILLSVGMSVTCWVLFAVIFQLPLPEGLLEFVL
ncbi:MAG TPA: tripartite tricarboxylate transporter TctB family protein [Anaerovoracaceae bacterium]|nr:tripartite tricarboxylate transporter TctB family protein [Anaerovoracaceae bacterium]